MTDMTEAVFDTKALIAGEAVREYLTALAKLMSGVRQGELHEKLAYRSPEVFILAHGQYWPVDRDHQSKAVGRFQAWPQACFSNAYQLATRRKGLRYVEGYALGVIPVHHAWCVTESGDVVDPTWHQHSRVGSEYFGVAIPIEIARQVRHRDNHSVILNWQRGFPLLARAWPWV